MSVKDLYLDQTKETGFIISQSLQVQDCSLRGFG